MTTAQKILAFNQSLSLDRDILPEGIRAMNPFSDGNARIIRRLTDIFYNKYYDDPHPRKLILGINPGRLGAGTTGIPFSDTKRLESVCEIPVPEFNTHEPSSVFVYEMIEAFGGVRKFYDAFYISSVCPLGFVIMGNKGREVNFNYYDRKDLQQAVTPFIIDSITKTLEIGIDTEKVWSLGSGKNFKFLDKLNREHQWFGEVVPLDHPRYVMQYRSKRKAEYIVKYLRLLKK